MEYTQDRLRAEIRKLESEVELLKIQNDRSNSAEMVAEIMLCIIVFVLGMFVGHFLL